MSRLKYKGYPNFGRSFAVPADAIKGIKGGDMHLAQLFNGPHIARTLVTTVQRRPALRCSWPIERITR